MMNLQTLCGRLGLSERAIRRRLTTLGSVIDPHVRRGEKNAVLLTDSGIAILDRLNQLQQDAGLGLNSAVEKVKSELNGGIQGSEHPANTADDRNDAFTASLEARIREQSNTIAFLQDQLEKTQGQIQAMLPATTDSRQRIGRLMALRIAVLGR